MTLKKSKILAILLAAVMAIAFMPLLPGNASHAVEKLKMGTSDTFPIAFDSGHYEDENEWFFIAFDSTGQAEAKIESVTCSDTSVVAIKEWDSSSFILTAKKVGSATVKVTGKNLVDKDTDKWTPAEITYDVVVEESFYQSVLKHYTWLDNAWYGTKKIEISTRDGATGTVKIGSDKYSFKAPDGKAVVKLKKVYPLNTSVKATLNWRGVSATKSVKLYSATFPTGVKVVKKKNIKVEVYNVHKGDVVKVTYKGKTYSKKIKKDKDGMLSTVTVKSKKKLKKNATLKIKIVNAKKKTLDSQKIKLTGWEWVIPDDDDEDTGSEY